MRLPLSIAAAALLLSACAQEADVSGDAAEENEQGTASEGDTPAPTQSDSEDAGLADAGANDGNDDAAGPASKPSAEGNNGFSSSYTKLDLEKCRVLAQNRDEGGWIKFRCPGYQGIPLFVSEGDLRFDVDAGVENSSFATIMAFNDISETFEWRMRDGKPFAVIFRYRDGSMETGPRSVLAVEKIGRKGDPGCRVAQIAGETPNANRRARQIADSLAVDFDCSQEPQYVGNAR